MKENTGEHGRKRKPYKKISDELRAKVGKYAAEQGNTAAVCKFKYGAIAEESLPDGAKMKVRSKHTRLRR